MPTLLGPTAARSRGLRSSFLFQIKPRVGAGTDGGESGWPWPSQRGFSRTAKFEKAAQDFHRIRFELFVTVCGKFTIHRSAPCQIWEEWRPPPAADLARGCSQSLTLSRNAAGGSP
jgi:hypothetical protein